MARSTRPFLARGGAVKRCQQCQLATANCICAWRVPLQSQVDILLILHRDEVFKPTNTGRLIADILPANTLAFEWSRLAPDPALLAVLRDPQRYPVLVFPADADGARLRYTEKPTLTDGRILTLVLLDGTWKQATKMFRSSAWLADLPVLNFDVQRQGAYAVRQAIRDGQLATAEAAAALLDVCGEVQAGAVLADYFAIFNEHYRAARNNHPPQPLAAHMRLADLKTAS